MRLHRNLFAFFLSLAVAAGLHATIGSSLQLQLGNPSGATSDPANHARYFISRAQYAMDYSDTTRDPNWVAWDLTTADLGGSGRSDFTVDTTLPTGFNPVLTTDYSGSGYDRGHMCPSGDRTVSVADNQFTFFMSNMVPQAPDNNQGIWANFESYCRSLAGAGNEVLIVSGPSGFAGSSIASGVAIPGYVWKIAVVVPLGPGSAVSRITASTRVIALKIPNIQGVRSNPWQDYVTSAAQIETDTGFTFFTELPASTAAALRTKIDGQTAVGAPSIVTSPEAQNAPLGGSVTFTVVATGDAPLSYQWVKDDVDLAGATSASLTVAGIKAVDAGNYFAVVSNAVGSVTSNAAALVVTGVPPSITTPVASQTVAAGDDVTFVVGASGSPTLTYQWRQGGSPLAGATLANLKLVDVQDAAAGLYDVVVTNSVNTATSAAASLTVTPSAPRILAQPIAQNATGGTVVTFSVSARGTAPLSYQWRKNGVALSDGAIVSGATSKDLFLTGVTSDETGSYDVAVTNAVGSTPSSTAALAVNAATIAWTFGPDAAGATANPTSGLPVDITGGTLSQGNNNGVTQLLTTTSVSTVGSGFSGGVNAGAAARTGAFNPATSAYFEFTLAPAAGKKLVVTGITFGARQTSTGPRGYSIYSSFDGYATPLASGVLLADSVWAAVNPASFTSVTGTTGAPVTFRIFGHGGTGSASANTANWRIDDLKVKVSTVAATSAFAPAVVSTTPASGTTGVGISSPITITFNQPVNINAGWFALQSALSGPLVATVTGGPTTFTLTPPGSFAFGDTITATVLAGKVVEKDTGTLALPSNYVFSFGTGLPVAPAIAVQPLPRTVADGGAATFSVTATGTAPLTYQWRKGGAAIVGNPSAATATLSLTPVTLADAGDYDCVVSNPAGNATTDPVTLAVLPVAPAITTQPKPALASLGGTATFTVEATGSAPLTYGWRRNGTPLTDGTGISGASGPTLTLTGIQAATAGTYDVVVTNTVNSATSQPAALGVTAAALNTVAWDFATAGPTSGLPAGLTGGSVTQGNNNGTTALLTAVSVSPTSGGFSGGNNAGAAARTGALNSGSSAYFEFTLAPAAAQQVVATALSFGSRSTGTGPQAFAVFTSVDGFTSPVAGGTLLANSSWALVSPAFGGVRGAAGAPVTFRIFGYNGTGSPGTGTANWRIDDLKLTAGTELLPAVASTSPATGATGIPLTAPVTITFNQPVDATGAWFTLTSVRTGPVAATVSGGPTTFTLMPATPWNYGDTIAVSILASRVRDLSGTLGMPANHAFSFTTVLPTPPGIASQPASRTATVGDDVSFSVLATGTAPLAYQWRKGGAPITGNASAATATLTLKSITTADAADYDCVVTNVAGQAVSDPATLTVNKAVATVTIGALSATYDGRPKAATVSTNPAGLTVRVTYNGGSTPPVNAGAYLVSATVDDPNYLGSATASMNIIPAAATLTLADLYQVYDGTPKRVSVGTAPAGLDVIVTYNSSVEPPVAPGTYAVVATVNEPNYSGTTSGTLVVTTTALVRHAPDLSGGIDGSVHVLLAEDAGLKGNAWISGDLLVPGSPTVQLNGNPTFGGIVDGTGLATPSTYRVTLSGNAVLRHLVRRTNPVAMPVIRAPLAPAGTRNPALDAPVQPVGDFATLRNLALNSNAGQRAIPPGVYGAFSAYGNSGFILGVAGATTPAVYDLQGLTLSGNATVTIIGPVILHVSGGVTVTGKLGAADHPEWLTLNVASGGLTLNGNATVCGFVVAPDGAVTLNGTSTLVGGVACDRLTINGNGQLKQANE